VRNGIHRKKRPDKAFPPAQSVSHAKNPAHDPPHHADASDRATGTGDDAARRPRRAGCDTGGDDEPVATRAATTSRLRHGRRRRAGCDSVRNGIHRKKRPDKAFPPAQSVSHAKNPRHGGGGDGDGDDDDDGDDDGDGGDGDGDGRGCRGRRHPGRLSPRRNRRDRRCASRGRRR
jgi:hypothetical protein